MSHDSSSSSPGTPRPWYKNPAIFIGIPAALVIAIVAAFLLTGNDDDESDGVASATSASSTDKTEEATTEVETTEPETSESESESEDPDAHLTDDQKAIKAEAEEYLGYLNSSRQALTDMMEREGYSAEDAAVAIDDLGIDWNVQAQEQAKSHSDRTNFSATGLVEQLESEG